MSIAIIQTWYTEQAYNFIFISQADAADPLNNMFIYSVSTAIIIPKYLWYLIRSYFNLLLQRMFPSKW